MPVGLDALERAGTPPVEDPAPLCSPHGSPGRGGEPAAEPARPVAEPAVDQAVFDAEFAAIVLTEYPPGQGERVPARIPPRPATQTRRGGWSGPPAAPRGGSLRGPSIEQGRAGSRRRPGPGPRSPPPPANGTTSTDVGKEVSGSPDASLNRV